MIACSSCNGHNPHGAIFCLDCGTTLGRDRHGDTQALLGTGALRARANSVAAVRRATSPTDPLMEATILPHGRQISLRLATPALVGRYDRSRDVQPDLDLSDDGGYDGGVSRRHARFFSADGAIYVEDLASANGTFINDRQLAPHKHYAVGPNMYLRFGSVVLRIDHT